MMNRLIDTMTGAEVRGRLSPFFDGTCCYEDLDAWLTEELENLVAEEPHWSDNLDPQDDQTWVFCFVSDDSPKDMRYAEWISLLSIYGYRGPRGRSWKYATGRSWKYATPVDLNLRYGSGDNK